MREAHIESLLMQAARRSGFDKGVVLEHDPTRLRQARKLLHSVLQPRPLAQYREILEHHVDVLLRNTMREPEGYVEHIRQ